MEIGGNLDAMFALPGEGSLGNWKMKEQAVLGSHRRLREMHGVVCYLPHLCSEY